MSSASQPPEPNSGASAAADTNASAPAAAINCADEAQQHHQQQRQRLADYMSTLHPDAAVCQQHRASTEASADSDCAGAAGVTTTTTTSTSNTPSPNAYDDAAPPPPYDESNYKVPLLAHGKLPTYEEVEQEKADTGGRQAAAAALAQLPAHVLAAMPTPPDYASATGLLPLSPGSAQQQQQQLRATIHCPPGMRVIAIHPIHPLATANANTAGRSGGVGGGGLPGSAGGGGGGTGGGVPMDPESLVMADDAMLGTDSMFLAAFLLTFIFNWMGFLLVACACHNIAARYGALAGFGLSLAKWTLIVKNSSAVENENAWLWWLIMGFGFLICVRATLQYVSIKKSWRRMTVASAERMLVYDN